MLQINAFGRTSARLMLGASVTAVAFGGAAPALAQVEEIVVTAQKVEENIQDVPIAITAISGDRLAETGTISLENIGDLVPSVTFRKGTTSANSAIIMRGVGTITFSVAAEPSVSTVVDGVVLSRSGQAFSDLLDIDRLEILRGPQGTLFGKNASAGLVSIISKGGTETLQADLRAEYYEGDEYRVRGSVSGPLSEDWSARMTGFYGSYDGNIRNIFFDEDVNGYEHYGARGIVDYEGNTARLRLIADYFRADDDCCADVTGVSRGAVLDAELGFPVALGTDQRTVNHNLITETRDKQWSLTSNLDLDVFDTHTLSVILGYRNWKNTEIREGDFLPRAVVGTAELHDTGFVETGQYSAEVRLASDQTAAFFYQVGAFYWHSDNRQDFTREDIVCATSTLPVAPSGATPCNLNDPVNTTYPTATSASDVNSTNYALFGQATYRFTDQFSLTGGLRWTRDELEYVHTRAPGVNAATGLPLSGPGVSGSPAGGTIASGGNGTNTSAGSSTNNNISGKASVQFEPTEDLLLYASYTRGYKGPAFNVFFNHTAPNNAVPIDEEISDAFEIGLKSQFWDRRIQVNTAIYQATYDGFQANNFILLNGTTITNLTNAGTVRTKGVEIDTIVAPVEGLTFRGSVAYADAKVREFNPNPVTGDPDARNGTRLPLAPKWSWNIGADYETEVSDAFKVYASTIYSYTGSQFSDLGAAPGAGLESYGIWNASLGVGTADDLYRLTLHARNITDKSYALLNVGAGQRYQIPRDADRYFGVTLSAKIR
ncbi:TonB-dependent receptor [Allopontixanthobacter sediminis]|uniref:TonB-dependent receptor n=1 Tax=Allopontixanthobacter sediminis TaxID=1689985 RepID=A0A845AZ68_9SPHN|nr:TonB-dependent receptor [Allopontixanthobacter sediminis]MXP43565.1 TonB-dependent receptor [Allopontixanthobacter sediminis]